MKTYNLMITANVGYDAMCFYSRQWTDNPLSIREPMPVCSLIGRVMPTVDWQFDDGHDGYDTDYLQLVYYPEGEPDTNYLLASWHVIDKNTEE